MNISKICVVTDGYPSVEDPHYTFVEELCREFSKQGLDVTVVAPQSVISAWRHNKKLHPVFRIDKSVPIPIKVYQPKYFISLPTKYRTLNNLLFRRAVNDIIRRKNIISDVYYGHFWANAFAVCQISVIENKPLFVAVGEGNLESRRKEFKKKLYDELKNKISGAICVSTNNKNISVDMGLISPSKTIVLPNAIDNSLFKKKNKSLLREAYGYSKDDFIISFVGAFVNRKGSRRLSQAINKIDDDSVKSFFIGGAIGNLNEPPECNGILYMGKLPHHIIPDYLNMSDIFVLPTLNEGCCNAIIEALACGLPVVSANLPFNWDVLDDSNSIMVDPENIDEIASAILELKNNKDKLESLSIGALKTASKLTIRNRAANIIDFIKNSH